MKKIRLGDTMKKKKKYFGYLFLFFLLVLGNFFCMASFKSGRDLLQDIGLLPFRLLKEKDISMDCNSLEGQVADLKKQVEELSAYLELEQSEGSRVFARVIKRDSSFYHEMTLNKGKKDGVQVGDAVLTKEGFIGMIRSVQEKSSVVSLIMEEQLKDKISVQIDDRIYGLLTGYDDIKNELIIQNINSNEKIKEGMNVKTGFSSTYPTGLFLGSITSISSDHFDLEREVRVQSKVDFHNIRYVMVIR